MTTLINNSNDVTKLHFTKMQGLGNDFMVINGIRQPFLLNAKQIQQLSDRHFGVGFDQLLLVEASSNPSADFVYRIFNADGQEVNQCGNGARCIARFVREQGLSDKTHLTVQTRVGSLELNIKENGDVTVNMGIPEFEPKKIPFAVSEFAPIYLFNCHSQIFEVSACSLGNPHAVIVVEQLENTDVQKIGQQFNQDPRFPEGVNVGFIKIENRNAVKLRVFERGVGETFACGSGAAAAVAVGRLRELLNDTVTVTLPGGQLTIVWKNRSAPLYLSGPTKTVYEGTVTL